MSLKPIYVTTDCHELLQLSPRQFFKGTPSARRA